MHHDRHDAPRMWMYLLSIIELLSIVEYTEGTFKTS